MIKKFCNMTLVIGVLVLLLASMSCKKNNVTKIKTDNSFAISLLAEDTISIGDVLGLLDSNLQKSFFAINDSLYFTYAADTLKRFITGDSLLDIDADVDFDKTSTIHVESIGIPEDVNYALNLLEQGFPIPPGFSYTYNIDTTIVIPEFPGIPFSADNFSIKSAVLKGGTMTINLNISGINADILKCQVMLESENIIDNGNIFIETVNNGEGFEKNLVGCTIEPEGDSIIGFNASVRFYLASPIVIDQSTELEYLRNVVDAVNSVGGDHEVNLEGNIKDIKLKSIVGKLKMPSIRFGGSDSIDIDITKLVGDLKVLTPDLEIKYVNTFGLDAQITIDTLELHTKTDILNIIEEDINLNLQGNTNQYSSMSITGELVEGINIMDNYVNFKYAGELSVDEQDEITVSDDSEIDIATFMKVPLNIAISQLTYRDTLEMSMDSISVNNYLDQIELKFDMNNGLPVALSFQAYLLDEDDNVTDSLFDETNNIIGSYYQNVTPENPYHVTNTIIVTDEKLNHFISAKKMAYKASVTTGGLDNWVWFKSTNFFSISIGIKTKTTEIDVDNIL